MKKFNVRVRFVVEKYCTVTAKSWAEAEERAEDCVWIDFNAGTAGPNISWDFEEFNPADFK